ncbi:hypothetical protein L1987_33165 [Smallanthus sonchifolius]|uniref:Uncharacterized protein n=1 Tax=Smallanthus sonchifolius TaxID=185202 RepID=A0ACB9HQZ3_9ASTR|nr:hypothetical protein L1987_33165 [Smallanthus sonchifolius]
MSGKGKGKTFLLKFGKKKAKSSGSSSDSPTQEHPESPPRHSYDPYLQAPVVQYPYCSSLPNPYLDTPPVPYLPSPYHETDYSISSIPSESNLTNYFASPSSSETRSPYNLSEIEKARIKLYPTLEETEPSERTSSSKARYRTPSPRIGLPPLHPAEPSIRTGPLTKLTARKIVRCPVSVRKECEARIAQLEEDKRKMEEDKRMVEEEKCRMKEEFEKEREDRKKEKSFVKIGKAFAGLIRFSKKKSEK